MTSSEGLLASGGAKIDIFQSPQKEEIRMAPAFRSFIEHLIENTRDETIKAKFDALLSKVDDKDKIDTSNGYYTIVKDMLKLTTEMSIPEYHARLLELEASHFLATKSFDLQEINIHKGNFDMAIDGFLGVLEVITSAVTNSNLVLRDLLQGMKDVGFEKTKHAAGRKSLVMDVISIDENHSSNMYHLVFDFNLNEQQGLFGWLWVQQSNNKLEYLVTKTIINRAKVKRHYITNVGLHSDVLHQYFDIGVLHDN